jgi:hypothetical protein
MTVALFGFDCAAQDACFDDDFRGASASEECNGGLAVALPAAASFVRPFKVALHLCLSVCCSLLGLDLRSGPWELPATNARRAAQWKPTGRSLPQFDMQNRELGPLFGDPEWDPDSTMPGRGAAAPMAAQAPAVGTKPPAAVRLAQVGRQAAPACRRLARSLLPALLPPVVQELQEWTASRRSGAARTLRIVVLVAGAAITAHLEALLPALCSAVGAARATYWVFGGFGGGGMGAVLPWGGLSGPHFCACECGWDSRKGGCGAGVFGPGCGAWTPSW